MHVQSQAFYRAILDGIPSPVFIVEEDVRIVEFNTAAGKMLGTNPDLVLRRRAGDILHCLHSEDVPEGCGQGPACSDCLIRNSVNQALVGRMVVRLLVKMETRDAAGISPKLFLFSASPLDFEGQRLALVVLEDISEVINLRRLLPICSRCKQVRTDRDYWQSVEEYFQTNLDIGFSHGMCPACAEVFFPDYPGHNHPSQAGAIADPSPPFQKPE